MKQALVLSCMLLSIASTNRLSAQEDPTAQAQKSLAFLNAKIETTREDLQKLEALELEFKETHQRKGLVSSHAQFNEYNDKYNRISKVVSNLRKRLWLLEDLRKNNPEFIMTQRSEDREIMILGSALISCYFLLLGGIVYLEKSSAE